MSAGTLLWSLLLPRWRGGSESTRPGYTLLLPVPHDLPVFAQLALDVCRLQEREHRVETLVISDLPSASVSAIVERARPSWPDLHYVAPKAYLRPWLRFLNDPGRYHGVQLVTGAERSVGSHIMLHDADAILIDASFLDGQYVKACETGAAAVGVHPLWDAWLREQRGDLVATWEMCARVDWLRSVPPFRHLAHSVTVAATKHVVDTTVYAQLRAGEGQLVLSGDESEFVHFNYVVSTYRKYQASSTPILDERFRILFIRVLTDFLTTEGGGQLPSLVELRDGLTSGEARVRYPSAGVKETEAYADFRVRLEWGLQTVYGADTDVPERLSGLLSAFDEHYSYMRPDNGGRE